MKTNLIITRWIFLVFLLFLTSLIWSMVWHFSPKTELEIAYLDIGQGDATLITAPNGNRLLIDGGEGAQILTAISDVLPFYDRRIDILLATHAHTDHLGGFPSVIDRFKVQAVIDNGLPGSSPAYNNLYQTIDEVGVDLFTARRGMLIHLDKETVFVVLFPDRELADNMDPDDGSIVGQLIHGQNAFIFTGDAGQKVEEYLVNLDGSNLESEILKAGHHGSRTSTAHNFVGWVDPKYAIISAGRDNRHGHPHSEVLETLNQFSVQIESTFETGHIIFSSDGREVNCLTCLRQN